MGEARAILGRMVTAGVEPDVVTIMILLLL